MRQIAEFVAGLACALFSGAAVYLSLVEHPARMECGVELAATEFAPSYRRCHAGEPSSGGTDLFHCSVARRSVFLMGHWRGAAGLRYPIHADCDPSHQ